MRCMYVYSYFYFLVGFAIGFTSCESFDAESGERVPGLCVNMVSACPIEVPLCGDDCGAIVSSFDMPIYPHPDCRDINPNNRSERKACTVDKIREFVNDNIVYPQAAIDNQIQGPVTVTLIASFPYGCLSSIDVSGDLGYGTICELQRVLALMPSLESEREYSQIVYFQYRFRYDFTL